MKLGQEPDFSLGGVQVSPSRGIVSDGATEQRVTPQVMQALLVLLRAEGRTVTRDELIEACWDGRIVSDDAINRVIALLRGLARQFEPPPFQLETIPKIGFWLDAMALDAAPADGPPVLASSLRRRVLIGAAGAAVVAGLGAGGWWAETQRVPKAARAAMESGWAAFRQMTPDYMTQAIAAFERATTLAPQHAEAWGLLALAYKDQAGFGARADVARVLAQRAGEAARRALAIDPDNAEAAAALIDLRPSTDWIPTGKALKTLLARHPQNFFVNWIAAGFYSRTGQVDLVVRHGKAAMAADPGWPKLYYYISLASWSLGQVREADDWIARGFSQWPRHYTLWFGRQRLLTYTGRAAQALVMIDDVEGRPLGIPAWNLEQTRQESHAILTRAPEEIAAMAAAYPALAARGAGFAINELLFMSAVGRLDEAFAVAGALLLARGQALSASRYSPEQGQYYSPDRRETWPLWAPQAAAMRSDPRLLPILRDIGLVDYWRATGTKPATPIAGL